MFLVFHWPTTTPNLTIGKIAERAFWRIDSLAVAPMVAEIDDFIAINDAFRTDWLRNRAVPLL